MDDREILVKSIAQYIPTYAMSCFRLPMKFHKDVTRICAKFWWGGSSTNRKIYWVRWEKFCLSKDLGV